MNHNILSAQTYIYTARQLWLFIKTPTADSLDGMTGAQKLKATWSVFIVKLMVTVAISVVVGIIYDPVNTTSSRHAEFTLFKMILVGVLVLPFMEEVAFRLSLKFKPLYLALSTAVLVYYFSTKGIYHTQLSNLGDHFYIRASLAGLAFGCVYWFYLRPKIHSALKEFWQEQFSWVVYMLCLTFALMHTFNYELTLLTVLLLPLILLPKLVAAFCYSFVRIRFGFIYAVAMHLLWNGMGVAFSLISLASD